MVKVVQMLNEALYRRIIAGRRRAGTEIVQQAAVSNGFGMRNLCNRIKIYRHFHHYRLRKKHVVHVHVERALAVVVLRKNDSFFSLWAFGACCMLVFMSSMLYAYTDPAGVI